MSKVFISYKRGRGKADENLATKLEKRLWANHEPFRDVNVEPGLKWNKQIRQHLEDADVFVVLLSERSIHSDWVKAEVGQAAMLAEKNNGSPRIIPVRFRLRGDLPSVLEHYLGHIQHAECTPRMTHTESVETLVKVIDNPSWPQVSAREDCDHAGPVNGHLDAVVSSGNPLPAADPRWERPQTAPLSPESEFYMRRASDAEADRHVERRGTTTIVMGPLQSGKSSLLLRMHRLAVKLGHRSWYLDFARVGRQNIQSLDALCRYIAKRMSKELKAVGWVVQENWDDDFGPMDNLADYLEGAFLSAADVPLQLIFDQAERLFDYPYCNDFYSIVRAWGNRRSTHAHWQQFNAVFGQLHEPTLMLQDHSELPFNVGDPIRIEPLRAAEVVFLQDRFELSLNGNEIATLLDLVGGHPYLVRVALYTLAHTGWGLGRLIQRATHDAGPFADHLAAVSLSLPLNDSLRQALRSVVKRNKCPDVDCFRTLARAGLIRGTPEDTQMRCRLYRDFFSRML